MITYGIWKEFVIERIKYPHFNGDLYCIDIIIAIFLSLFFIPIDLLLSPIELIGFIIYKINRK